MPTTEPPYVRRVHYGFEVDGWYWQLSELSRTGEDEPYCDVEETEKNGQEDTHMSAGLLFAAGRWQWADEEPGELPYSICKYAGRDTAVAVLDYVNRHGHPELPR